MGNNVLPKYMLDYIQNFIMIKSNDEVIQWLDIYKDDDYIDSLIEDLRARNIMLMKTSCVIDQENQETTFTLKVKVSDTGELLSKRIYVNFFS
jgi:hypothetical protein